MKFLVSNKYKISTFLMFHLALSANTYHSIYLSVRNQSWSDTYCFFSQPPADQHSVLSVFAEEVVRLKLRPLHPAQLFPYTWCSNRYTRWILWWMNIKYCHTMQFLQRPVLSLLPTPICRPHSIEPQVMAVAGFDASRIHRLSPTRSLRSWVTPPASPINRDSSPCYTPLIQVCFSVS